SVGRTHLEEVCGELSPMGGTPHWSRGRANKKIRYYCLLVLQCPLHIFSAVFWYVL
ncbi:unnamed protein product, partial [Bubo scandiacus]